MLAYSPLADRLASRLVREPPMLGAFGALKRSRTGLIVGIVVAWALGDVLEEVALHGVVLGRCETLLSHWFAPWLAALAAICLAAALGGVIHLYQGRRGALIVAQLSVLFGVCDQRTHDLWSVILCHGFYATIAFVRLARRRSRYSDLTGGQSA